jgi:hypothetical protein
MVGSHEHGDEPLSSMRGRNWLSVQLASQGVGYHAHTTLFHSKMYFFIAVRREVFFVC